MAISFNMISFSIPLDYLRILPPGTETNTNLYGELIVSIGELAWLKTAFPPENTKIRVKFWG